MSDSYSDPQHQAGQGDGGRDGQRSRGNRAGGREGGGFRIRLSDNEMRSARALQEAFNLRSTVAVLGFAVRSLGQMLEDGQLDALIEQQRNQPARSGRRDGGGRDGGGRDGGGRDGGGRGRRFDDERSSRGSRPNPFARPAKPQPEAKAEPVAESAVEPVVESVVESEAAPIDDTSSAPVADGSALEVSTDETKTETTED
ncbi:hypothetical protein [Synechococcus sp. MU1611]|uniref:hypothetical protein n=1 Tax=Synechococcus sp. MU1611 TaxID=2508345 RepID=UPI001CF8DC78|nr:hypothetical protein [Synechococcus sp. MU1611]MCB4412553.1 hypothetical protein [Synechococcus sp. MU1611]